MFEECVQTAVCFKIPVSENNSRKLSFLTQEQFSMLDILPP
jgi:hypothetical protein